MTLATKNSDFLTLVLLTLVASADAELLNAVLASLSRGFVEGNLCARLILLKLAPALTREQNEQVVSFVDQLKRQLS